MRNNITMRHIRRSMFVSRSLLRCIAHRLYLFSPDGKLLAAAGGRPARMGEVQIWDVEKRVLKVSVPVGFDTVYGVNWSPDGKLVSFGCPDKTVRAIDASTGKQVLQQMAHDDWVLDTVFSTNGSYVVSVG